MQICKSPAADSWLCDESLTYVAECLELCEDAAMVQDLRQIFPRETLIAATKRVSPAQRERLREWVIELNRKTPQTSQNLIFPPFYGKTPHQGYQ